MAKLRTTGRTFPNVVINKPSPNFSFGIDPKIMVVHATSANNIPNSVRDLEALAGWFSQRAAACSSHVGVDGDGFSARFVPDTHKAWHCAGYNGVALGIEQVGQAYQTTWTSDEVHECARWLAYWSIRHDIPLRKARVYNGRVLLKGVKRHSELGAIGGNHDDPGKGYPLSKCLALAKLYKKEQLAYEKKHGKVTR